jgi:hypothetical protein
MAKEGWIKLHRRMQDSLVWESCNSKQRDVLINLLMMANHQQKDWLWMGKRYTAKPGQFVTSLDSIKAKCSKDVSIQNIRTTLVLLSNLDFLTDESTKQGRLITILNWAYYQGGEDDTNKAPNSHLTDNQQTTNRQLTANKNVKKVKNEKNLYEGLHPSLVTALENFKTHRKKLKKEMTDHAVELLIKDLYKMSNGDVERCVFLIDHAIKKGWQGVYEPREESTKGKMINFMDIDVEGE